MPRRDYSHQFKLDCVHKAPPGCNRPETSRSALSRARPSQSVQLRWRKEFDVGTDDAFEALAPFSVLNFDEFVFCAQCL